MYNLELWQKKKKELNLTLEDISNQTGISISTIKDIFRGATYAPRIDTVQTIEKALGINGDLKIEEDNQEMSTIGSEQLTALENDMLRAFREVGKKHGKNTQDAILNLLNNLTDD